MAPTDQPTVAESLQETIEDLHELNNSLPTATRTKTKANSGKTATELRSEFDKKLANQHPIARQV